MSASPSFVSLFSGCGGMDVGFIRAGFKCLQAFDIDRKVIDIHRMNIGDSAVIADLREISKVELLAAGRPEVIIAGSPCQGFSTVGKREIDDPRNSLLLQAGRLAIQVEPQVFIAENVAGALSGEHKTYWDRLGEMLNNAHYKTLTVKLNASQLGLAQLRSRVIMVAWKGARAPIFQDPNEQRKTLAEVLAGIDGLPQHEKVFLPVNPGQKLCNVRGGTSSVHTWEIPEVFGHTTDAEKHVLKLIMKLRRKERLRSYGDADPVSAESLAREMGEPSHRALADLLEKGYVRSVGGRYDLVNTFNGKYRRLSWDSISLTVDTRFGDHRYFLHPSENRSFTVREAARIQGFPDSFLFPGKPVDSFKMIGNAVPPPMAEFIARSVAAIIE
jgi:DNA (cytosine-5)-methyltransferase 1